MRVTVSIDIMPRHIQTAGVILAGISILVLCGSNSLPILKSPPDALYVIGPLVAPATEFAQFIAIGPENRLPQRHRAYGIAAYVAFVALCNQAVARYYSSPNVRAVVQDLCSALRGEAPVPDFTFLDEQEMDELTALMSASFMSASLSVFTLLLALDLVGPWSGLRTFHFMCAIAILIMPAIKYTAKTPYMASTARRNAVLARGAAIKRSRHRTNGSYTADEIFAKEESRRSGVVHSTSSDTLLASDALRRSRCRYRMPGKTNNATM